MENSKKHILIVDDDDRIRNLLKDFLSENNYIVSSAEHADEAKEKLQYLKFDIIILDVMMPGKNGYELTKEIKKEFQIPIILLTAKGEVENRIKGLELGADDYIGKPFDSRELLLKIEKNISKKQSLDLVNFGNDTKFDLKKEKLLFKKQNINLSSNEVKILKLLINNSHQYLTRDLLNTELGLDYLSRSGDMQISRLRLKLKKECNLKDIIRSVHGKGYKIFI